MSPLHPVFRRGTLLTIPALSGYAQPESGAPPGIPPTLQDSPDRRVTAYFGAVLFFVVFALILGTFATARAQDKNPILSPGDAVVTGFSGIKPPAAPLQPGKSPLDGFFIDPEGPSAQILSLATMGGQPSGQLVTAPALKQLKAGELGQVFAIALDDGLGAKTPNIYLGATSAFGLQIVAPDKDGDGQPERLKKGEPGAEWMEGQFGPNNAGPGAIWKVDGSTGEISLFATLAGNSGPGVGDIVFDKAHKQFFASDLDSGLIYRIGETGEVIDSFDHGTAGRPAKGLAEIADDGRQAQIDTNGFDIEDPTSWGYTQDERMVWGLAVHNGRLFYVVAGDHQVWSIGIADDGSFAGDARWEFDAKGLSGDGPITDMLFDSQGRIYLAQRGKARGSYDYSLFAEPEKSSVTRYRPEQPDDPATPSVWIEEPEDYAIGMPPEHRHAEGGIALGFAHDETGSLRLGACGQTLWSTGHRLRPGALAEPGPVEGEPKAPEADVHGLQGNDVSLVRPQNVPPQQSYFIDYDGFFGDAAKAGHMGDVEIWQPCDGVPTQSFGQLPPGIFPPGDVPPDEGEPDWPGDDFNTNLKLTKRATPHTCLPWVGGWLCRYTIRVTNTGPDNYFGPIYVDDWLPANPAGAVFGFSPTPPWHCWATGPDERRCRRLGVFLAPGSGVSLTAYVWVPKAKDRCHLRNVAEIHWPHGGTQWNSDPTDDADDANALIPDPDCKDHPKRTDLKIYKRALGPCFPWNGKLRCGYRVTVENQGPGAYNGDIVVEDVVPAGTTPIFSGPGWNCTAIAPYTCKFAGASLPNPGDSKSFIVRIDLTKTVANHFQCKIVNKVKITEAPGGSPSNIDPTNDTADAVAVVPAQYCDHDHEQTDLTIYKRPLSCFRVDGHVRCGFRVRVVNLGPGAYNGDIEVKDFVLAGMTPHFSAPGWTCTAAAPYICKYAGANLPNPGNSLSFFVRIDFSYAQAKELNCKLRNKVEILKGAGGTPQNFNPNNDVANAVAVVPEEICGDHPRTNLKIEKKASPTFCSRSGNDWWCTYLIRVINTGPGFYHGSIKVEEALPAEPLDASWNAPWNCVGLGGGGGGAVCTHPNTDMAPITTRILHLRVKFSGEVVKQKGCLLPNVAKITHAAPGSAQNTNPGDDIAGDTAKVPAEFCKREPANLELRKVGAQPKCNVEGGKWRCPYGVIVKNTGPGDYNGKIVVKDWVPAALGGVQMQVPDASWSCNDNLGPDITCEHPAVLLKPAKQVVLPVYVFVDPAKYNGCSLQNTAKILQAPGGSIQNQNAGDDQSSATLEFPPLLVNGKAYCYSPEPIQPCPPGFSWNGGNCSRIGTFTPPPPPPVIDECPDGFVGTPPNCRRIPDGGPHCPQGTVGRYPNCRDDDPGSDPECRGGQVKQHGQCVCPGQLVWNGKRCARRECPAGMTGHFPNCHKPTACTGGRVSRGNHCVCPGGKKWNGKHCVPDRCPRGMTGTPPNCHEAPVLKKRCPAGQVGRPPFCRSVRPQKPQFNHPQRFNERRGNLLKLPRQGFGHNALR